MKKNYNIFSFCICLKYCLTDLSVTYSPWFKQWVSTSLTTSMLQTSSCSLFCTIIPRSLFSMQFIIFSAESWDFWHLLCILSKQGKSFPLWNSSFLPYVHIFYGHVLPLNSTCSSSLFPTKIINFIQGTYSTFYPVDIQSKSALLRLVSHRSGQFPEAIFLAPLQLPVLTQVYLRVLLLALLTEV